MPVVYRARSWPNGVKVKVKEPLLTNVFAQTLGRLAAFSIYTEEEPLAISRQAHLF